MASSVFTTRPLVSKLQNYGSLSLEEEQVLEDAVSGVREVAIGADLVAEGSSPDYSTLLLSGFVGRYNVTTEGARQITALQVPGDFVDLHSFLMKPMDHSIVALTICTIATVPHAAVGLIFDTQPRLGRLFWLNTLIDGATHRQWSVGLGSLLAHEHLAHLICELYLRLEQIGMTEDQSFHIPMTQLLLSECLAVSAVHANRSVQTLRHEGVIRWERDLITILDWDRLAKIGQFDPSYLRIRKAVA